MTWLSFFSFIQTLYTNLDVKEEELQEQKDEVCLRFSALFPSDCSLRSWQTAHTTQWVKNGKIVQYYNNIGKLREEYYKYTSRVASVIFVTLLKQFSNIYNI